jgi:hypothetical protein
LQSIIVSKGWGLVNRDMAVEVTKQLLECCGYLHGKSVNLILEPNNQLSTGYQIQIDTGKDEIFQSCIEKIAQKNSLKVYRNSSVLTIYNHKK